MNKLKKKLKEKHILPVYRCDVIECAKEQLINSVLPIPGICVLLRYALCEFNISYLEGNVKEILDYHGMSLGHGWELIIAMLLSDCEYAEVHGFGSNAYFNKIFKEDINETT